MKCSKEEVDSLDGWIYGWMDGWMKINNIPIYTYEKNISIRGQ